jgi:hypothetical protein
MAINWSILQPTNPAAALQAGIQAGQTWRRETDARGALSALATNPDNAQAMGVLRQAAPEVAYKMEDRLRADRSRKILSRVFTDPSQASAPAAATSALAGYQTANDAPQGALSAFPGVSPAQSALGAFQSGGAPMPMDGQAVAGPAALPGMLNAGPPVSMIAPDPMALGTTAQPAATAPTTLVDPTTLPPRTDGIKLNPVAMRELYKDDPETAFKIQEMMFKADAATFKSVKASGGELALAARHLAKFVNADGTPDLAGRQAELEAITPRLQSLGVTPDMLGKVDLTDRGLSRYLNLGRNLDAVVDDDRADRQLDINAADKEADNSRADRNTDSVIEDRGARRGLIARGQDMTDSRGRYGIEVASGDRRRGQDISASTSIRGQDLTDKRTRDIAATRPTRGASGGGGGGKLTRIAVGANGKKVGWNGKAWVPAQ